ncbi:hypothetical protein MJO28_012201 [Puccinia striiformis f. sp. tritici]|uniref:Uncharacterized protein n=1 Tax=Puccinia striiformis f. sp. tritici TaxID=168172 RepID=A0ACC0DZ83_9BASI|nr:hypothetical protein MJO28_012201 [Puccinia striiformis f. sp. tritici]KAI7945846.1 hypothetical protein MJO29_012234 [Puccinia striiformis f. sp. tritici]
MDDQSQGIIQLPDSLDCIAKARKTSKDPTLKVASTNLMTIPTAHPWNHQRIYNIYAWTFVQRDDENSIGFRPSSMMLGQPPETSTVID